MSTKRVILAVTISLFVGLPFTIGGLLYYINQEAPLPYYAFASDRDGNGDIFVLSADSKLHNLTNSPHSDWEPTWSADGKYLAYTSHQAGNSDIWVMEPTLPTPPRPYNLTENPAWDYSPTWSPTGQSIAFVSERDGDPEIFIQHLQAEQPLQLTFNDTLDHQPNWSPDGKYVAFAAVRNGVEQIYRIRPDGTDEQLITPHPLQGTAPAWSPDSQKIAFVGWNDDNVAGIYIIGPQWDDVVLLYQGQGWLGSLAWSADGQWLTFTTWQNNNHELMALSLLENGPPINLTDNPAWDDFVTLNPQVPFVPPTQFEEGVAQAATIHQTFLAPSDIALGMNIADLSKAYLINDIGFQWAKSYVNWATVEPLPGEYRWTDPDNIMTALGDQNLNILMRVHGTPTWNRPDNVHLTHPPDDLELFADFLTQLATRYKGQVQAYEIWNEPNLNYEWGYQPPDPTAYTQLLQTAYTAIKAVDPEALIISGGLSTTGDGSATAYGDLAFIDGMYLAGAKGYFDALGSHPYSFGNDPDIVDPYGLSLSRVEEQHQRMVAHGDGDTPIWITETGWVIQNSWDLDEHEKVGVSELQQADYMARTSQKIEQTWPFVEGLFFFNLDFSTVAWYPSAEPMRWYAILNPDRTPRPAYTRLREQQFRNEP